MISVGDVFQRPDAAHGIVSRVIVRASDDIVVYTLSEHPPGDMYHEQATPRWQAEKWIDTGYWNIASDARLNVPEGL